MSVLLSSLKQIVIKYYYTSEIILNYLVLPPMPRIPSPKLCLFLYSLLENSKTVPWVAEVRNQGTILTPSAFIWFPPYVPRRRWRGFSLNSLCSHNCNPSRRLYCSLAGLQSLPQNLPSWHLSHSTVNMTFQVTVSVSLSCLKLPSDSLLHAWELLVGRVPG